MVNWAFQCESENLLPLQEDFERVVSILLPLRYHISALGGSKGQQDVVNLTLIDAALRLPDLVRYRGL